MSQSIERWKVFLRDTGVLDRDAALLFSGVLAMIEEQEKRITELEAQLGRSNYSASRF